MITDIELLNFGICQVANESADATTKNLTGYFLYSNAIEFTDRIDKIKARKGLRFGIEYILKGVEEENAEVFESRILHPLLINPNNNSESAETVESKVGCIGEANFDYYKFEYDWEVKPGKWFFEVRKDDCLLLRKEFDVSS